MHMRDRQQTFDRGTQLVQSLTGIGGDDERIRLQCGESFTSRLVRLIGLVEYENTRNRGRAFDVRQHVIDRVDLRERVRVGAIDHMQDHVGLGHLFQGGFERLDQLGGQAAHEADRVHVGVSASVAGFGAAHGRVQCGEQRVFHQFGRTGQTVGQRGFAGVRVADHGHCGQAEATA